MSIYRGAGGASDATNDATVNAVAGYASAAASSATNAATSAANAATSAGAANTSVTSATTQASNAATSASNAASSASSAAGSVTSAATQASNAATSASNASTSASNASTSASNASTSATVSASSASASSTSAGTATTKATEAAASAASALAIYGNTTAMNAAVTASQTAASNAATSASSAATSAASALVYKDDAAGFASDANASYIAAAAAAAYAATTVAGFDGNVASAITSAANASASASAAATSANNASTSATQAAASAAGATAIVTGVASTRPSIRPSLLLDFANTRVLDPRITFTRASTATFYDNDTSAVAEQNLLLQSEAFDNAAWAAGGNSTRTSNTTIAPDGTTTADTITAVAATGAHFIQQLYTPSTGATTLSVYAKTGTSQYLQIALGVQTGTFANFDLTAGTVGTTLGVTATTITSVGSNWYRCTVSFTNVNTNGIVFVIASSASDTRLQSWTTTGAETIFLWGAQLEQRSAVTAYTPTTTAAITNYIPVLQTAASGTARFDCNPVTRESLGLLIEESRTNLLTYSEQFDNAAWTKVTSNVTANNIVAPNGTLTVDKIYDDVTASTVHYVSRSLTGLTNAATYTATVYAKAGEKTGLRINLQGATNATAYYNLSTGVVGTVSAGVTATMSSVGNGWYRCFYTRVIDDVAAVLFFHLVNPSETVSYTGDGYSGLYIWGAQLEAGAFATSYIPTVASQVTRAADAASMTGTNFSNWFNVAQGAITATCSFNSVAGTGQIVSINDGGTANESYLRQTVGTNQYVYVVNTVTQAGLNVGTATANSDQKLSGTYQTNNLAASANGSSPTTDTLGSIYTFTQMNIGSRGNTTQILNGTIKRIAYYPIRLSNTELQGLTS